MFEKLAPIISKTTRFCKNHAPEILTITGTVTVVAAGVVACKKTLQAPDIIKEHKESIKGIKEGREIAVANNDELNTFDAETDEPVVIKYTEKDYKKDIAIQYGTTAARFIKLYWKPVTMATAGTLMIFKGTSIFKKRNAALIAAYATVDTAFKKYRTNVIEKYGTDEDWKLLHGIKEETITVEETDENGKTKKVKKTVSKMTEEPTDYSVIFDFRNENFQPSNDYNFNWIRCMNQYLNDNLMSSPDKLMTLNEVYKALGYPQTLEGANVGWNANPDRDPLADGYIEITAREVTIDDEDSDKYSPNVSRLILDFNVDGPIIGSFKKKNEIMAKA